MKNASVALFTMAVILFAVFGIGSCKKGCKDVMAVNYSSAGKGDDGSCEYAYTPFVGTYTMSDTLYSYTGPHYSQSTVTITKSDTAKRRMNILLMNGALLMADISGNTFTIPGQNAGGTVYRGDGSVNGNTLYLLYRIFDDEYVVSSGQRQ